MTIAGAIKEGDILELERSFILYITYYSEIYSIIRSNDPMQKELFDFNLSEKSKVLVLKKHCLFAEKSKKQLMINRLKDNLNINLFINSILFSILYTYTASTIIFLPIFASICFCALLFFDAIGKQSGNELLVLTEIGYSIRIISGIFNECNTKNLLKELKNTGNISGFVCYNLEDRGQKFWLPETYLKLCTKTISE